MAQNRMSGNLLGLEINGEFVSCEMSCEFNFETDLRGASPKGVGRWKEVIPGVSSWSISLNAGMLMKMAGASVHTVLNAFLLGEIMIIRLRTRLYDHSPVFAISGQVYVQNGGISASVNARATWNTTLTGNGAFTFETNNHTELLATDAERLTIMDDGNGNFISTSEDYDIGTMSEGGSSGVPFAIGTANKIKNQNTLSEFTELGVFAGTDQELTESGTLPNNTITIIYED
jgi:predicted secreted protein